MTIHIVAPPADIFASTAQAIVVPVNAVGTTGKGLAKSAAKRWPEWADSYRDACKGGNVAPGDIWAPECPGEHRQHLRWVVALATKDDWRYPSRLTWVESGLHRLADWCREELVATAAVPALGCGCGGLRWADVLPLMRLILEDSRTEFTVYAPHEAQAEQRPRRGRMAR